MSCNGVHIILEGSTATINGKRYTVPRHNNLSLINSAIYLDGKKWDPTEVARAKRVRLPEKHYHFKVEADPYAASLVFDGINDFTLVVGVDAPSIELDVTVESEDEQTIQDMITSRGVIVPESLQDLEPKIKVTLSLPLETTGGKRRTLQLRRVKNEIMMTKIHMKSCSRFQSSTQVEYASQLDICKE